MSGFWAAVGVCAYFGVFHRVDAALSDLRFALNERQASGDIVVLDIDSASLREVGVWPWPRRIYAEALDRLASYGSAEIAFDIDFSSRSAVEEDDALLETALENAGGYAMLAAFQQVSGTSLRSEVNLPLERFQEHAAPIGINVITDGAGLVRSFPAYMNVDDAALPSLAVALTGKPPAEAQVYIDFSIDPASIDRISFADVLRGTVDPSRLADKQVVIGASALELRDFFSVPRHGTVAGPVLQVLAAETLKQGRGLRDWGQGGALGAAGLVGLFLLLRRWTGLSLAGAIAGSLCLCAGVEALAAVLQASNGIILRTAAMHATELGFVIAAMAHEVGLRRTMHAEASRERDSTRMILDRVIADNFDGVVVVDETGKVIAASHLADSFFGNGAPILGRPAGAVLPDVLDAALTRALAREDQDETRSLSELELTVAGEALTIEFTVTPSTLASSGDLSLGQASRHVACLTFHDITERKQAEQRLRLLAEHDALTGALSRPCFIERVDAELASGRGRQAGLTMLVLDLSRFRTVNETLGHAHGDMALREVYQRLARTPAFAIARLGGDHFAIAVSGALEDPEMALVCADVLALVTEPYRLGDHRAVLGAKLGVSTTALSPPKAEVLLSHADMALSAAKSSSGNIHVIFSPSMDSAISEKQEMEVALRTAIDLSELTVLYQPQFALETGALVGVEALLRWHDQKLGAVSPAKFVPLAEETGLIVELGRWVLHTACRDLAALPAGIKLAVNISPIQFELSDVAADIAWALGEWGMEPERLDVEITEGVFVSSSSQVIDALERTRAMGVGVALDDFGTGYSSLSYLGRLPIDKIKIDQSFVRNLPADPEAIAIVTAVVALSHSLGKRVVAEGIETAAQMEMLRSMGCEIGQGYLLGRPESLEALLARLAPPKAEATAEVPGQQVLSLAS